MQPDAWNPGEARIGIQAPVAQESDRGLPLHDAPLRRRLPRTALLFREDFQVHGLTPGCSACRCIRKGAKICGHSERCRGRMEALVAQDPAGKARLEKAKRRLARYVELTGRWTRARKGDVGNFDPATYWWFFTPSVVDESKCLARRWAKGVGLQCTRFPLPGARVCGRHCKFQTHGLVTGHW